VPFAAFDHTDGTSFTPKLTHTNTDIANPSYKMPCPKIQAAVVSSDHTFDGRPAAATKTAKTPLPLARSNISEPRTLPKLHLFYYYMLQKDDEAVSICSSSPFRASLQALSKRHLDQILTT